MTSLIKSFLISSFIGLLAFMIDQYVKTDVLQLPDNAAHFTSLFIIICAVLSGSLLMVYLVDTPDYHDDAREEGTVKWFNSKKGYGFITRDAGDDVFVHYRDIEGEGRRVISEGERVSFVVVSGDKGLQAEEVASL